MARRSGKANSRRSRQRRSQQTNRPTATPRPTPQPAAETPDELVTPSDMGGASAFDKADAEVRAAANAPTSSSGRALPRRQVSPRITASGPSALGERAVAEYHYVRRDLRNIAVLVVVMVVLLGIATFLVNVLNIGPG